MGEYLKKFNYIRELVINNDLNNAYHELRRLLNFVNQDMINSKNEDETLKARNAIVKLLPVLEDLKKGVVSDNVITMFNLPKKEQVEEEKEEIPESSSLDLDETIDDSPLDEIELPDDVEIPDEEEVIEEEKEQPKKVDRKPLTPKTLDDYIGQDNAKRNIRVAINAAKYENRVLEHMLICSPYGLGKTTLANIIANEMNLPFFSVNSTLLKDTKSLSLYFSKIKESCIIFIDEIHSLKDDVQTVLLSILSDYRVSYIDSSGCDKEYDLPQFTLIGATTQAGELLKPFLNRFAIIELVDYTDLEKQIITKSKFDKLNFEVDDDVILAVANRSRGIPRTIETYVKGIRDVAISHESKHINIDMALEYFDMIGIDGLGLGKNDLLILNALYQSDRPLALITLESKTGIQKEDLEYRYEPYLLKLGFIEKTDRGRVLTARGIDYITKDENE